MRLVLAVLAAVFAADLAALRQAQGGAQQPSSITDRLPRFVNREQSDKTARADWLEPAATPYPLGSSGGSFTVEYTHRGKRLTLNDYFTRTDVLGFLVLHDGKNVLERYFHATGPSDRYLSMSVSKSIVSVAFGVAVDEGRIKLDDPVTTYLPRLAKSGYRDATVRHVLWMATGIQFSEEYGSPTSGIGQLSAANRTGSPSFEEFAATLPSERAPGHAFNYQSINTQVLAEILEEATGVPLNVYVERQLWKKIGTESRAYFMTGAKQAGICAYGCFYATLRDYARFGLMAMRGGKLTDERVVSERWIRESAAPAPFAKPTVNPDTGQCRRGYGFQWWVPCGQDPAFQAVGINGQAIYVNPAKRVVIAQFSSWPQASASEEIRGEGATVFEAIVQRLSR
jgi:CubicO group peptidase (beta-lactamase class C family)